MGIIIVSDRPDWLQGQWRSESALADRQGALDLNSKISQSGSGSQGQLPPPSSHTIGCAVRPPAVHLVRASLWSPSWQFTSPVCCSFALGTAWFMWLDPAFHHGPRLFIEPACERPTSTLRLRSSLSRLWASSTAAIEGCVTATPKPPINAAIATDWH